MERRKTGTVVAVVGVSALALFGSACASYGSGVGVRHEARERGLAGRRYETMRSLAHDLGERAERAANQARREARHRGRSGRQFLDDIDHFARRANDFHERMDRYRDSPWDVRDEVAHLNRDAQEVNRRIRNARVFERTYDDWEAVLGVLNRMDHLLAGYDLDGPRGRHGNGRDADRDYDR